MECYPLNFHLSVYTIIIIIASLYILWMDWNKKLVNKTIIIVKVCGRVKDVMLKDDFTLYKKY